jgi:hypothetical protein
LFIYRNNDLNQAYFFSCMQTLEETRKNTHGLYTFMNPHGTDDLWVFQSETGAIEHNRRLIAKRDYRPRMLQHFFQYCRQMRMDVPFTGTADMDWERRFYGGKFTGIDMRTDLRAGDVHWNVHIPEAPGANLADMLRVSKSQSGHTLWPIPQSFDDSTKAYPVIWDGNLRYLETRDEGFSHRTILAFDQGDVETMIGELTRDCQRSIFPNIPGWFFKNAKR